MSINDIGRRGEENARLILKNLFKVESIFQADWLVKKDNKWIVVEVKHQERFEKGKNANIEGHGLPPYQVKKRLEYYKDTGTRCFLLVIEKPTNEIYCNFLDVLNNKSYYDTPNGKRRIYPIENFIKLKHKLDMTQTPQHHEPPQLHKNNATFQHTEIEIEKGLEQL